MFDAKIRPLIDPPLNAIGRWTARRGIGANTVTLAGLVPGVAAGFVIAEGQFLLGLALVAANRLLDGLDGAVARATRPSDLGGYLDMLADYVFYVAVPVGFGFADPSNAPAALLLVASFNLTSASFLTYAVLAAKRGLETTAHGRKSFFYNTGLAEGTETILAFVLMCLLPGQFVLIAAIFTALCLVTVVQRSLAAWRAFGTTNRES